jgi:hypothetical protein
MLGGRQAGGDYNNVLRRLVLPQGIVQTPQEGYNSRKSRLKRRFQIRHMSISIMPNDSEANESHRGFRIAGMPLSAIAFLILSTTIMLIRSHYHLLWPDEFGVLDTVSISSVAQFIHILLTKPVMFDPVVYSIFAHASICLFGAGAFAIRLPSMCGYLLMQICLFYFVRRIASERAATFALAFPALMSVSSYAVQGRPYGLLLGLSALAMLSWQTATRRDSRRTIALVVLSLSLILAVNTQYYGVLLFIPLCAAESIRILDRRRVDIPVLLSISAGMPGILILLPFARALSPIHAHFMNDVNYHFITHSYLWMMMGNPDLGVPVQYIIPMQHILGFVAAVLLVVLIWGFFRKRPSLTILLPRAEAVFLALLAALPVFGYLLSHFVTKLIETRYVLPAIIGIAALLAVLIAPLLQNKTIGRIVLVSLFVAIAVTGVVHIRTEIEQAQGTMASLVLTPEMQRNLAMFPGQPVYVVNPTVYFIVGYYSPNPDIRSRITLIYSQDEEMLYEHTDNISITSANMRSYGVRNIVPYESVSRSGTDHLFLLYHNYWIDPALPASHAQITYLGQVFGGDLVSVRFP